MSILGNSGPHAISEQDLGVVSGGTGLNMGRLPNKCSSCQNDFILNHPIQKPSGAFICSKCGKPVKMID